MESRHSSRHRRRSRRTATNISLAVAIAAVIAAGLVSIVALVAPPGSARQMAGSVWHGATRALARSESPDAQNAPRKIYPYSIIAGGVHNKAQFEQAMRDDPVAAAHYANFNAAKFHLVKLQHAEEAYVSFRVGDNVYWTSHKVVLRKGSELISDGSHYGRTRCGNRISQTPRLPTYNHEPSARELNTAVLPRVETQAFRATAPMGTAVGTPPTRMAALLPPGPSRLIPSGPPAYTPFAGTPLYPPPPDGCGSGDTSVNGRCTTVRNKPPHNTPLPPPLSPTPENSTWLLFLTGLALAGAIELKRRRRDAAGRTVSR